MNDAQKSLALDFANALAAREYDRAYSMLSSSAGAALTIEGLKKRFEAMIPLDWGSVDPIEIVESPSDPWPFLYVSLGGDVYSEAIIVHSFVIEGGSNKIQEYEFGRP